MAQKVQFLGFKRVLTGAQMQDNYLYFVRDAGELEGKIWFNGVCYGSCRDTEIDKVLEALEGFIPASGEVTNVKEYIDEAIAQLESDVTTIKLGDDSFSGLTLVEDSSTSGKLDYTLTLTNVAPKDEFEQEKIDRAEADEALDEKIDEVSAATKTAIEEEAQAREDADDDLQEQIDELSGSTDDLQAEVDRIETAVGLSADGNYVADDGQYVSAATSVLDATAKLNDALVQEVIDRNQAIEDAVDALVGDASESGNTLGELEDRIEELSADAKEYHLVKIENGLPATVKERYELQDASGNTCGTTIDIAKDSHIVSIRYISDTGDTHYQNLEYTYLDVCGATKTEYVDMSQLVLESEFASGVTSVNGVVRGVVDPQSEDFLTVGANGFKLSGVQDAIDDAVDAEEEARKEADSAITENLETTATTLVQMIEDAKKAATTKVVEGTDNEHLTITSGAAADSSITYTITLTDVASATALTAEENARISGDTELQENLQTTADTLTAMIDDLTNGLQAELDAVETSLGFTDTAYTNSGTYICGTSVTNDIKLLDTALDTVEGNFTDALAGEADLRASGDTALDARLDVVEEKYITGATVNGVDATVTDHVANVTIDAGDIELGENVTGTTGGIHFDATANTQDVFQSIVDVLNQSVAGSYTGVTSTGNTISVTPATNGNNIEFLKESATDTTVAAGHLELAQNENHEWYGAMYWIDEETA